MCTCVGIFINCTRSTYLFALTGLGTSTSKEAKEYFSDMERHRILFKYDGPEDDQAINLVSHYIGHCVPDYKGGWRNFESCFEGKYVLLSICEALWYINAVLQGYF